MLDANMAGELRVFGPWQAPYQAAGYIMNETGPHGTMAYFNPVYNIGELVQND